MDKQVRYTLGKADRLKSRKSIEYLFKHGHSFSVFPFRVIYNWKEKLPLAAGAAGEIALRVGFTVSSRNFKKAVDRNRVKRLMREAWRLQKSELSSSPGLTRRSLEVFLIYTGKELPDYKLVYEKITLVLNKLLKVNSEPR